MGGRRALVIGSQCESPSVLSFLPEAAKRVADALLDPTVGGCAPALADGRALLLDPTMVELDGAMTTAFERAAEERATLFLSIIGHGEYRTDDFYLMADDTPEKPGSRQAALLAQRVKELLTRYSAIDGLVLLLETCHAGTAAEQAGQYWLNVVGQAGRRFEVLTASVDRSAADGCFSRSLADILRSGIPHGGDTLRTADLRTAIGERCTRQRPLHLAYDGARARRAGDTGLWVGRNRASRWGGLPLAGLPPATDIDDLTAHYQPTEALSAVVAATLQGNRCVAITGAPGTGKSTTLAALTRPGVAPDTVPARFLHAVAMPSAQDTPGRVAEQLAAQLAQTVPGFTEATEKVRAMATEQHWASVDEFTRLVGWPLHHAQAAADRPAVRIAVDLAVPARDASWTGLLSLAHERAPRGVQLILTVRDAREVPFAVPVPVGAPTAQQAASYLHARGVPERVRARYMPDPQLGWAHLTAWAEAGLPPARRGNGGAAAQEHEPEPPASYDQLLTALLERDPTSVDERVRVLCPLAVLPPGSLLPVRLLAGASAPGGLGRVRDMLTQLSGLVVRTGPGLPGERAGLAHPAIARWLHEHGKPEDAGITEHARIAEAIARIAPMSAHDRAAPEHAYAEGAEAEHLWLAGRHEDAVRSLEQRASPTPVENRERWIRWVRRITSELGPHHELALRARARQARWTGAAGDPDAALVQLEAVFAECRSALGSDSDVTLEVWHDIAHWHAEAGRAELSVTWAQALVDASTALRGPRAAPTLRARLREARSVGQFGNLTHACELAQELVDDCHLELGGDHELTRKTADCLADFLAEAAQPEQPSPAEQPAESAPSGNPANGARANSPRSQ